MLRAQLLESLAALGEREKEGDEARKELERYLGAYARISEQQAALYQTHVRETRALKARLAIADRRAEKAEASLADDRIRVESYATMAEALEAGGDEADAKIAMMGRLLTTLRVNEIKLSRQVAAQESELKGLRAERASHQAEARASVTEAAAALTLCERERATAEARASELKRDLIGSAPKAELDAARARLVNLQRAYRSVVEQAPLPLCCACRSAVEHS